MGMKLKSYLPDEVIKFVRGVRQYSGSNIMADIRTNKYLKRISKMHKDHDVIHVAFIVQMAAIWDKEAPIYDAMKEDSRFKTDLIVVPEYDQVNEVTKTVYSEDNFFLKKYQDAVKAYEDGQWINLREAEYDYVFLQRPYDHYLPEELRSTTIVSFSKVCYIPYGFSGADVFNAGNTNKSFFRNVYFSFLESEYMVDLLRRKFVFPTERKMHRILNVGYPALIPYFNFPKSTNIKKVMWTPRWSFDAVLGGSNFLNYKDAFLSLVKKNASCQFVFRPHPLMIGEILRKGLMSQAAIDEYICQLEENGVIYDRDTLLYESMISTDLLITDYSSIIVEYFLTGRPIVYCDSSIQLNDTYSEIKKGMYVINNENEFQNCIDKIVLNNDPLRKERDKIIGSNFDFHKNATSNILKEIYSDFNREG